MLQSGSGVLYWEPRLGKTRTGLHAFCQLADEGLVRTLLVVTPAIGREVWRKEFQDEMQVLGLPLITLYGQQDRRGWIDLPRSMPRILVIGWDTLSAWLPWLRQRLERPYALCLDEPHLYTQPSTQRWKAAAAMAADADLVWELTGTWYKNTALDIYWQLRLIPGHENPFRLWTRSAFADEYCEREWEPFAGPLTGRVYKSGLPERAGAWRYFGLKEGAEADLLYRLQGLVDRRLLAECMDVPQVRRIPRWLDRGGGRVRIVSEKAFEQTQIQLVPKKLTATLDYVQDLPRPLVIFGWNVEMVEGLGRALGAPIIRGGTTEAQRTRIQHEFADGRHPILVCNLKSAGMAIDLSTASVAVFCQPYWSAVDHYQAERRILGPKQKADHVELHYLLFSESSDEDIWESVLEKGEAMERLDRAKGVLTGAR